MHVQHLFLRCLVFRKDLGLMCWRKLKPSSVLLRASKQLSDGEDCLPRLKVKMSKVEMHSTRLPCCIFSSLQLENVSKFLLLLLKVVKLEASSALHALTRKKKRVQLELPKEESFSVLLLGFDQELSRCIIKGACVSKIFANLAWPSWHRVCF